MDDDGARRDRDGEEERRATVWAQAELWLEIAEKLLVARDLVGCKRFAERAVEADPLLPGADELLAVADVLLASQSMGPSSHPDPLAILQLPPGASLDHCRQSPAPSVTSRSSSGNATRTRAPRWRSASSTTPTLSSPIGPVGPRHPPIPRTGTPSFSRYAATGAAAGAPAPDPPEFWTACPLCRSSYERAKERDVDHLFGLFAGWFLG
ncbi:uncharacterized protein [Miscanthus floridulus]|uniref:uncharacterized protein n=1 Tax=Miscanthus floridulus TaxID=154761 RepID=UPI00345B249F